MQPWAQNATTLAARIKTRQISAREAAQSAMERLEAVNPTINAVVQYRPEAVLAEAEALDARLAKGEACGALAGVPVTVKVNIDQKGFATTNGTILQKDLVAQEDGTLVANLRRAGAVILGRTNTPAFSMRWFTSNQLHGATKNPHDPTITPGGSSGGAGAAVAAGIGAIAIGTDIAGSIRYPAYANGVQGLRPSLGRIANYNSSGPERAIGLQLTSVAGPLARSVADLRLALGVLSAPDPRDIWQVPAPLEGAEAPRSAALCVRPGGMNTAPAVEAALRLAAQRLRDAGWQIEELDDVPDMQEAARFQARLWLGASYDAWRAMAARDGDPGAAAVLDHVRELVVPFQPEELDEILTRRATLCRSWNLFLAQYPVLLLPVSAEPPFPDDLDRQGKAEFERVWRAQITQIALPFFGLPGLSVATQEAGDMPMGVQIAAARFREDLCLAAAETIEAGAPPPTGYARGLSHMQTLAESILNQILADIGEGTLAPGARLEEKELASRYNVSRTPVREALRHLAATGMVEFRPRYGVFIADFSHNRWQELLEVTAELEAATARYAASRMSEPERAALRAKQEQIGAVLKTGDTQGFDELNAALHGMIWHGAHNATLLHTIERLRSRTLPYTRLQFIVAIEEGHVSHMEHDTIVRAICAGQPELAYQAMHAHVLRAGALPEGPSRSFTPPKQLIGDE